MRILALEPYYGGSHKAFLDGWIARSRHAWTVLGLPAHKWKWRMRHGAVTLAGQVRDAKDADCAWDALVCSDMLNLAEFLGLAPEPIRRIPSIAYFHENQLTYPVRRESERDLHFAFTNMTTALAATAVWFNSAFHRGAFLDALTGFLQRMPDHQPLDAVERIRAKSSVHSPGVDEFPLRGPRRPGPLRILWAARWEHDKNPEDFFKALALLEARGFEFRVSVIGERFSETPIVFEEARRRFADRIDRWGFQESREEYEASLKDADVVVSTAGHEFFGLSVVEAIAAGCRPLLPDRLSYPEILGEAAGAYLYGNSPKALADAVSKQAQVLSAGPTPAAESALPMKVVARYLWKTVAPALDRELEELVDHCAAGSRASTGDRDGQRQ
ncbi:MAG: DUF3524 domain-containing protein [Planctomycetota bacterium]|nr:DUF3524 domain-containing protein [Planctomycetota bacterium]